MFGKNVVVKMPKEYRDLANNAYTAAFSVCSNGVPNVAPVSMKQVTDDEVIMVSDQYMGKTLSNLNANPRVALSAWESEGGYWVKVVVTYEKEGPRVSLGARGQKPGVSLEASRRRKLSVRSSRAKIRRSSLLRKTRWGRSGSEACSWSCNPSRSG